MPAALQNLTFANPWVRTREPLLWLGSCGHETRQDPSYFFDCRRRADNPHVCLQLTLSGEGFYERKSQRTLLPIGTAFIDVIPGPFRYGYPPNATAPYEQVFITMLGPVAERWCGRLVSSYGNVLHLGEDSPVAPLMLAITRQHASGSLPDRYTLSAQLYQLFMTILSTLNRSRMATSPRIARALAIIARRNTEAAFNVMSLAKELDCSREHLTRQFIAATGVSPSDYITQHRLRLAIDLLRSCEDKLDQIAHRCGFSGANYFCRAFRQRFGITPAQFRARPWMVAS